MNTRDFHYDLPADLIAQEPLPERDASRMMVLDRRQGTWAHRSVRDLPDYLDPGDLLVVNDTRVFPARVYGERADTGGKLELLLLEPEDAEQCEAGSHTATWRALCRSGFVPRPAMRFMLAGGILEATVQARLDAGGVRVRLRSKAPLASILEKAGHPPLPPYIRRDADGDAREPSDRDRYQTVYARETGAVAAPTAGLHFTPDLLNALERKGVRREAVTLHVGPGTFRPVTSVVVADHTMESEFYRVPEQTAVAVGDTIRAQRRVVAVGSTSVRTLETVAAEKGRVVAAEGRSSLFIYPPFEFRVTGAMLTNFHLPCSTLIMMISAFAAPGDARAGRDLVLAAYREAVARRYRFYSYGDCMLLT